MPFPNEHAARINDPDQYIRFRRENDTFGDGIHTIWGILSTQDAEVQSIRFSKDKFTVDEAKKWLKDNDFTVIEFEPASGEGKMNNVVSSSLIFKIASPMGEGDLPIKIQEPTNPDRVIRFKASDDTLDRHNEVIMPSGWVLDQYIKNPVVMQFHDYTAWPIGKATAIGVVNDSLYIDCEFDTKEIHEDADIVFRKILHGTIKSGSVGFIPVEEANPTKHKDLFAQYPQAKRIYVRQELLEWTICPIPANPNALAASLQKRYFGTSTTSSPEVDQSDEMGDVETYIKIRELKQKLERYNG